jgi:hypothetical protein
MRLKQITILINESVNGINFSLCSLCSRIYTTILVLKPGYAEMKFVEAQIYNPVGRGFDSRWDN